MKNIILSLLCVITALQANGQEVDYKGFPQWSWHKEGNTEYYLYTPRGMQPGKKYPLALFLHGCCGVNDHATLRNTVDAPVRMWHNFGENTQKIPTYIIAPATSRGWKQHIPDIKKVIDSMVAKQNADAKRLYICGFSMGGEGTFTFINEYPNYFAAAMTLGMKFHGDSLKIKNLPMWLSQGETDYYSRPVRREVRDIRRLNGYAADTGGTWVTGVNPRYTNFKGFGHVVLWEAASRQDMVSWAYGHVNDGNLYPNVFFNSPDYGSTAVAGKPLALDISANDPDGKIAKINIYLNHKLLKAIMHLPYRTDINPVAGRNFIEAEAIDNGGKSRTATLVLNTIISLNVASKVLPPAIAGIYYAQRISAKGYGNLKFKALALPEGLELTPWGVLRGIPVVSGNIPVKFTVTDSLHAVTVKLNLPVSHKEKGAVLVTNATNSAGVKYKVSTMMKGESPNFNSKDTTISPWTAEINFSDLGKYAGLTYIKTDVNDTSKTGTDFLKFKVDENVVVCVCYEVLDNKFKSTIPAWLNNFSKQDGQIVAQYRYFNIYAKRFPKGVVSLPGADARRNGIGTNYFVMVKKE